MIDPRTGYSSFTPITTSDTNLVTCDAIFIGGAGNLAISPSDSATPVAFNGLAAGTVLMVNLRNGRVMATGTTATALLALQ